MKECGVLFDSQSELSPHMNLNMDKAAISKDSMGSRRSRMDFSGEPSAIFFAKLSLKTHDDLSSSSSSLTSSSQVFNQGCESRCLSEDFDVCLDEQQPQQQPQQQQDRSRGPSSSTSKPHSPLDLTPSEILSPLRVRRVSKDLDDGGDIVDNRLPRRRKKPAVARKSTQYKLTSKRYRDAGPATKAHKRRRLASRNRALAAEDFDQILTEIGVFGGPL